MHLACQRVVLRVGRVPIWQAVAEAVGADRLEFVVELDRLGASLDDGIRAPRMTDDIGVWARVGSDWLRRAATKFLGHVLTPDITIAVPLGLAATQPNAVDHAIADEPMMMRHVGWVDWIWAISKEPTFELFGNLAGHREVKCGEFFGHGGEVSSEVWRGVVEKHNSVITSVSPIVKGYMSSTSSEQQHAILAAALKLLAHGGPQALRVRDIATTAGCTTMAVYSRFGGKDGIVEAIYVDGFHRFTQALEEAVNGRPADQGEQLGIAYRMWALENPGSYQIMFTQAVPGFTPSPEATLMALGSFQVLVDTVQAQQGAGHLRQGDATQIAWAQWGMSHGLVMLELAGIQPTEEPVAAEAVYRDGLHAAARGFAPDQA
jgi:AcrR family transcriptional regulator